MRWPIRLGLKIPPTNLQQGHLGAARESAGTLADGLIDAHGTAASTQPET
jgi:hypothetical protein